MPAVPPAGARITIQVHLRYMKTSLAASREGSRKPGRCGLAEGSEHPHRALYNDWPDFC